MTRRICLWATCLALSLLAAACASTREGVALDTGRVPAADLVRRVREESDRVRTLTGSGTLMFDSPSVSGTAEFSLALIKPDSLLLRLEGPFGIDVGLLFIDADEYVAYNSFENEVIRGAADSAALRALIPVPLSSTQIVDAFSGRYPVEPDGRLLEYRIDDDRFLLTALSGSDTCRYWIDPEALAVTSYRRTAAGGRVLLEAELERMTAINGIQLPRNILLRVPSRRSLFRVLFADLDVNGEPPEFSYTIPASARRRTRPLP
jgi:hypothetical protein